MASFMATFVGEFDADGHHCVNTCVRLFLPSFVTEKQYHQNKTCYRITFELILFSWKWDSVTFI